MTDHQTTTPDGDDIDLLLPWYATGRLSPDEAERVRRELDIDPTLAYRLSLAEEEMAETTTLSEALPAPSIRARNDVFARIEALEGARGRAARSAGPGSLVERVMGWFEALGPRNLAWAGGVAALLIVIQAGVITSSLVKPTSGVTYTTASHGDGSLTQGSFALVSFLPGATMGQITTLLNERGFVLAEGPRSGSLYRVRLSSETQSTEERDRLIASLRSRTDLVGFVVPAP